MLNSITKSLPKCSKRLPCDYSMDKCLIEPLAQLIFYTHSHINSSISQSFQPLRIHNWVGIYHPNHHLFHFSFNQSFSTWWRSPIMITWFQAHISRCTLSQLPSISQSKYLHSAFRNRTRQCETHIQPLAQNASVQQTNNTNKSQ